jgi:hypothetical protein
VNSVPYVVVLILSDLNGMVGGELKVARLKDPQEALQRIKNNTLGDEHTTTVEYTEAGCGIFMQGSVIAHAVTPVIEASEDRISLINSYQTLCPFEKSTYIYRSFKHMDPMTVLPAEVGRGVAWRAMGQLQALVDNPTWGPESKEKTVKLLAEAIKTLEHTRALINDEKEEEVPFVPIKDLFDKMKAQQEVKFTDLAPIAKRMKTH